MAPCHHTVLSGDFRATLPRRRHGSTRLRIAPAHDSCCASPITNWCAVSTCSTGPARGFVKGDMEEEAGPLVLRAGEGMGRSNVPAGAAVISAGSSVEFEGC